MRKQVSENGGGPGRGRGYCRCEKASVCRYVCAPELPSQARKEEPPATWGLGVLEGESAMTISYIQQVRGRESPAC